MFPVALGIQLLEGLWIPAWGRRIGVSDWTKFEADVASERAMAASPPLG